jgi:cobalt-zinc-cadmium efflux system outer membrane protein
MEMRGVLQGVLIGLGLGLGGCAEVALEPVAERPAVSAMAAELPPPLSTEPLSRPALPRAGEAGSDKSLKLGDVLALVSARNADLMAGGVGVDAVAAHEIDAGRLTNPEASIYTEDFGAFGPAQGSRFLERQTTLQLGQAIPLTAKLGHERALARGERALAQREYEIRRLQILADAARTFITLVMAQDRAALAKAALGIVEQLSGAEEAKVEAGQMAPFERSRAVAALAEARLRLEDSRRDVAVLRQRLASFWNGEAASFRNVAGDLSHLPDVPDTPKLLARIDASPEIVRNFAEIELRRAALALERAKATPDLTINGGIRYHEDGGDYAFVAGVSMPLPVYNQNTGNIVEAGRRQQQAEFQLAATKSRLRAAATEDREKLTSAAAEIEALQKTLIPASEQAVSALREGYRLRKFPLSELLLGEQSLMTLREKLLAARGAYHLAYADLEQLLGGSIEAARTSRAR